MQEGNLQRIEELARLMRGRRGIALTGAGISTESGIPDYRGPTSRKRSGRPILYREFIAEPSARARYWARSMLGWPQMASVKPNAGHFALASIEAGGSIAGIITQNVDGLHQSAGSREVLELHGSLSAVRCVSCGSVESRESLQVRMQHLNPVLATRAAEIAPDGDAELAAAETRSFRTPSCLRCSGVIRPEIVFFGENVPSPRVETAFELVESAEFLLVAGSSLAVYSGFRFVQRASKRAIPVAIINLGQTRGDDLAAIRVEASTGEALPRLAELLTA